MDFTNPTSMFTIPKNASINDLPQFTFRAWVYYGGAEGSRIFQKTAKVLFFEGNKITFLHDFSITPSYFRVDGLQFAVGNWYDIQISYDNTTTNKPVILINGVNYTVTTVLTPSGIPKIDSDGDLILANLQAGTASLNGYLSEVELYAGILSVAEAKRSYNSSCLRYGLPQIP